MKSLNLLFVLGLGMSSIAFGADPQPQILRFETAYGVQTCVIPQKDGQDRGKDKVLWCYGADEPVAFVEKLAETKNDGDSVVVSRSHELKEGKVFKGLGPKKEGANGTIKRVYVDYETFKGKDGDTFIINVQSNVKTADGKDAVISNYYLCRGDNGTIQQCTVPTAASN